MNDNQEQRNRAVALSYNKAKDRAPRVVASGRGELARRIIEIATACGIPIHEDPDLLELLAKLDLGMEIPPELYKVVAEILVFVYRLNNRWPEEKRTSVL